MTCQLGPGFAPTSAVAVTLVPFISQIAACPLVFCHRMSDLPLPSKSLMAGFSLNGVARKPCSPLLFVKPPTVCPVSLMPRAVVVVAPGTAMAVKLPPL